MTAHAHDCLHPVDLALGEASPAVLHDALAAAPELALDVAEVRDLFARFEPLCSEVSPRFHRLMVGVERRAAARVAHRTPTVRTWPWVAAAAALTLVALRVWHPLGGGNVAAPAPVRAVAVEVAARAALDRDAGLLAPAQDPFQVVEARIANEGAERLLGHLASSQSFPAPPALEAWVQPSNLLALGRRDRELLASATLRREVLARQGSNPDMDDRVQRLASEVAVALADELARPDPSIAAVAASVRGLLHSGGHPHGGGVTGESSLQVALARGAEWLLAAADSGACGTDLPLALEALVEHSAATGAGLARVRAAVNRFVEDQLVQGRGRPLLADWQTGMGALAAAGRVLRCAPAFGADPNSCHSLRCLAWSHLREREAALGAQPGLLAAVAYGFADFGDPADGRLYGYRLSSLLPDLTAVQHMVWGSPPGTRGSTRVRMDLRRLAAFPTPPALEERAALLVALVADYACAGPSLRQLASG